MLTSTTSATNDPRRTLACNDITLPTNSNQGNLNSFFRRRTQQQQPTPSAQTFNGQLDKSASTSSSTKSSLLEDNAGKATATTFSLLRHHSSHSQPNHKIEKATYDNLTDVSMLADHVNASPSNNVEPKPSFSLSKKSNRHPTSDSLTSDAYDNYPDKNGYDNYPIRKTTTAGSMMTTSQNDSDGRPTLSPAMIH